MVLFQHQLKKFVQNAVPKMKTKGTGLITQIKSLEFMFGIVMMQPILQMILKVSKLLQGKNLGLLISTDVLNQLKS